jgi:hypothetical protein
VCFDFYCILEMGVFVSWCMSLNLGLNVLAVNASCSVSLLKPAIFRFVVGFC